MPLESRKVPTTVHCRLRYLMSYIYNTLSWAHRVPYKVETVEKTRQIARENEKKTAKKVAMKIPSPQKNNSRKNMKNNHKKMSCTFWKTQKETWERKQQQINNSKKSNPERKEKKWKPQSKKNLQTTRIVHPKKNKPPTIWQKKQKQQLCMSLF